MVLKPIVKDLNTSIENLRLAWRKPWVRVVTVLAVIGYVLYAWVLFPTYTARVRIGMDVTVNGVTRSTSNVIELKARIGPSFTSSGRAGQTSVRGEAAILSLGARAAVVMLVTPLRNGAPDWIIRQVIAAMGGDLREPVETGLQHVAAQSRRFEFSSATTEVDGREEHPLQPDVIFLADRHNFQPDRNGAADWAEVPIHHPDAVLGTSGATIVLWAETVSRLRPLTRGEVTAKLPFFNSFWARNHVTPPLPPALRPANFKVD